jgi:predicted secreted protein
MLRLALAVAAVPLVALACNGCHHDTAPPNPPGVASGTPPAASTDPGDAGTAPGETVVHVDDDGKTFDLARGATMTFKLATHAGTGFAWMPAPIDGGALLQQGERTTELTSDTPGAPRMDVYRFLGQAVGITTIEMDLRRPWGEAPPAKTIRVTVNVH